MGTRAAMTFFYVALGGAIGATLRYLTALVVVFPFGTLLVNVVGSFLIGLAFVHLTTRGMDRAMLFGVSGLLGGFTTFSAFSLDALKLVEKGQWGMAGAYVAGTVILSLTAVFLGVFLARGASL